MPRLVYALLANDMLVDRESGSTSFIRTVEHVLVPVLPVRLPNICLGTLWELDGAGPFSVEVRLHAPSGKKAALGKQEVLPAEARMHRLNFRLGGMGLEEEGRYAVVLVLIQNGKALKAAELPLYVLKAQPRQAGQA
jgi:hypothetical protein